MTELFELKEHYLDYQMNNMQNIKLGFTTRENGLSHYPKQSFNMARYIDDEPNNVTRHQELLAKEINFPREDWVFPIQVHGNQIAEITHEQKGINIKTLTHDLHGIDGIYTYESNILLTMCYADCVPVYFYSEKHGYVGLAHAGWRGTYGQIVKKILEKVNFDFNDLQVVIGPATSSSYEINDDIKSKFEQLTIDTSKYIYTRGDNQYDINLKKANALLLEEAGVPEQNIYITNYATSENLDLFFSYRVEKGKTGRMLAFIGRQ
ncbi:peptidoglycan editing factor PgeF [Staphylococcus saccharolyticus]|uniref:peptidoglycan editing factor PgeF n=1 Tax=Staphylococcus saccharolyticus TaxID=33028 RepID=UPI0032E0136D